MTITTEKGAFAGPWADEAAVEGAPWWKTRLQRRHERIAYHTADRIVTLSESMRGVVIERYGVDADRVKVVPGGIDALAADPGGTSVASRCHRSSTLYGPGNRV